MATQPGRCEKRSDAIVRVMLTSLNPAFPIETELTLTQNISDRGARVTTKRLWSPSDSLVIKSLEGGLQSEARVIYHQRMREDIYAIGLQLIAPRGDWQRK